MIVKCVSRDRCMLYDYITCLYDRGSRPMIIENNCFPSSFTSIKLVVFLMHQITHGKLPLHLPTHAPFDFFLKLPLTVHCAPQSIAKAYISHCASPHSAAEMTENMMKLMSRSMLILEMFFILAVSRSQDAPKVKSACHVMCKGARSSPQLAASFSRSRQLRVAFSTCGARYCLRCRPAF